MPGETESSALLSKNMPTNKIWHILRVYNSAYFTVKILLLIFHWRGNFWMVGKLYMCNKLKNKN